MRIWTKRYTLSAKSGLNAKARSVERHGSLLRIEENGLSGFADLHPWPELGDLDLDRQLRLLADGHPTALSRRSLVLARADARARAANKSLFAGLWVPTSHYLINDCLSLSGATLDEIWRRGFRVLKIKLGRELAQELAQLQALEASFAPFRLRLDFNAAISAEAYARVCDQLPPLLRMSVEFVEDPFPFEAQEWRRMQEQTGLPLALDRIGPDGLPPSLSFLGWIVIKPAVQDPDYFWRRAVDWHARVCVTSYLDHPLGQLGAAWVAARLQTYGLVSSSQGSDDEQCPRRLTNSLRIGVCGLCSHLLYDKNEFSDAFLEREGPRLQPPEGGSGFGFDELLEQQDWTLLR